MQKRNRPATNFTLNPETKKKLESMKWKLKMSQSEVVDFLVQKYWTELENEGE
jgi:hypothetical protein